MLNHEAGKHGDQCCGLCPEHIQMERDDWLKAWNKHCAQAEKEVQDAYGRD